MKKRKTVKQQAIDHYDRMIKCAEKLKDKKIEFVDLENASDLMINLTGESWRGRYCSYCRINNGCDSCSLSHFDGCCGGEWFKITEYSENWKELIQALENVRQYIIDNGGKNR